MNMSNTRSFKTSNIIKFTAAYTGGQGGSAPLELRAFTLFKPLKSKEHTKKLVCRSFSALRRLYTWTRATMIEVRMKNLFRIHIHPNRMGAIKDSEVKQLFFNVKPQRLWCGGSKRPFFKIWI